MAPKSPGSSPGGSAISEKQMQPLYISNFTTSPTVEYLIDEIDWLQRTETRGEAFMSHIPRSYTYGKGRGVRTYTSTSMHPDINRLMNRVNIHLDNISLGWGELNGVFLNRYMHQLHHLGWHSDDFEGMDHSAPIAVVSFGAAREIWWRKIGEQGVVPDNQRRLLENGSLFIMPPGFQETHQHRIPKHSAACGPRVSVTMRKFN